MPRFTDKWSRGDATIYCGNCLRTMKEIPDHSIDMVLCDLPYGTTACSWDTIIPFEPLWEAYHRVSKPNAAIVLHAGQPFTTNLIMGNISEFKYVWYWCKERGTGFQFSRFQPLRQIEDVVVFCSETPKPYNPQKVKCKPYRGTLPIVKTEVSKLDTSKNVNAHGGRIRKEYTSKHPTNIIYFARDENKVHPTQKPAALAQYLIRTYTNPGDTVLDNTMGSGTPGVAAIREGRKFIGIELLPENFSIARERIKTELRNPSLFAAHGLITR